MLTSKEWIIMIVPILIEGVLIFFFQSFINRRFSRLENYMNLKTKVKETFLEKLTELRFQVERTFYGAHKVDDKQAQEIMDLINLIFIFYRSNKTDLKSFSKDIVLFSEEWTKFVSIWNSASGHQLTDEDGQKIKNQLDNSIKYTESLIQKIRKSLK